MIVLKDKETQQKFLVDLFGADSLSFIIYNFEIIQISKTQVLLLFIIINGT